MGISYYIRLTIPILIINIVCLVISPIIGIPINVIGFCVLPIDVFWIVLVIILIKNDNNYKKGV